MTKKQIAAIEARLRGMLPDDGLVDFQQNAPADIAALLDERKILIELLRKCYKRLPIVTIALDHTLANQIEEVLGASNGGSVDVKNELGAWTGLPTPEEGGA